MNEVWYCHKATECIYIVVVFIAWFSLCQDIIFYTVSVFA